jgi:hypothetical protein
VLDIFYIAGADAPIKQMPRYLRIGAAGEVRHWHKSCDALSTIDAVRETIRDAIRNSNVADLPGRADHWR